MNQWKRRCFLIPSLLFLAMAACGSGGDGGSQGGGTGTLALSLTDASTDQYKAIYITIDEVQIHLGGNENSMAHWATLQMPQSPLTLDLLQLANGVREDLGLATLPAGDYTQMRMVIGRTPDSSINLIGRAHPYANYLIDQGNTVRELKIPSGFKTGVKIVNGFTIQAGETTELILDFDACRSVVQAGTSGNWHLKPTIKVVVESKHAIIQGRVTNKTGSAVQGAMVSIQTVDGSAADAKDRVMVRASTISDEFGYYTFIISPGTYNLVAYKSGYQPGYTSITASAGEIVDTTDTNFDLDDAAQTGSLSGTILINGATGEQYATISVLQTGTILGRDTAIEVSSINVINGSAYSMTLPAGDYTCIASSSGYVTKEYSVTVPDGGAAAQDIEL